MSWIFQNTQLAGSALCILQDAPYRALLSDEGFGDAIIDFRHPEEARSVVSKDARRRCRREIRLPVWRFVGSVIFGAVTIAAVSHA